MRAVHIQWAFPGDATPPSRLSQRASRNPPPAGKPKDFGNREIWHRASRISEFQTAERELAAETPLARARSYDNLP